jgi:hypothetical protein
LAAKYKTRANREKNWQQQAFYNTKEWSNLSRRIRSSQPFCEGCTKQGIAKFGELVDHIVPLKLAWQLRLEPANLQVLCNNCHNKKRVIEGAFYMKRPEVGLVAIIIAPDVPERIVAVKEIAVRLFPDEKPILTIDPLDIYYTINSADEDKIDSSLLMVCEKLSASLYVNVAMNSSVLSTERNIVIGTSHNTENKLAIFRNLFPSANYVAFIPDTQFCSENKIAKEWMENFDINLEEHEEIQVQNIPFKTNHETPY